VIVKPHNTNTSYSPQTITNDIQEGAVLVDVRTPDEYKIEHAVGSINVPLQDMQNGSFGNLQQDQKIYIYCSSGSRSSQASDLLKQAGYTNVVDIKTLSSWKSLGGDVE
jgi:rhodanese-related sulfurtransferase